MHKAAYMEREAQRYFAQVLVAAIIPALGIPVLQAFDNTFGWGLFYRYGFAVQFVAFTLLPLIYQCVHMYFMAFDHFAGHPKRYIWIVRFIQLVIPYEVGRFVVCLLPIDHVRFGLLLARPVNYIWNVLYFSPSGREFIMEEIYWQTGSYTYTFKDYVVYALFHIAYYTVYLSVLMLVYGLRWRKFFKRHDKIMAGDVQTALSERK